MSFWFYKANRDRFGSVKGIEIYENICPDQGPRSKRVVGRQGSISGRHRIGTGSH